MFFKIIVNSLSPQGRGKKGERQKEKEKKFLLPVGEKLDEGG